MRGVARPPDGLTVVLYRFVLALYPPAFRRHFGGEMTIAFRDRARDAAHGGAAARLAFFVAIAADVVRSLAAEHVADAFGTARRARRSASLLGLTVLAGVAVAALVCTYVVADAIVLRPIPYAHADRLVRLTRTPSLKHGKILSERAFTRVRRSASSFEAVGAFDQRITETVPADGRAPLTTARLYGDLLRALGARVQLGRTLQDDDAARGAAVLDARAWRDRFGGDRAVIGRALQVDGMRRRIVGVLDDAFVLPAGRMDLYVAETPPSGSDDKWTVFETIGLLKVGVSSATVAHELGARLGQLPDGSRLTAEPLALDGNTTVRVSLVTALAVAGVLALLAMVLLGAALRRGSLGARLGAPAAAVIAGVCAAAAALGWLPDAGEDNVTHIRAFAVGGDHVPLLAALGCIAFGVIVAARRTMVRSAPAVVAACAFAGALALTTVTVHALGVWHDAVARAGGPGAADRAETTVLLDAGRFNSEGAQRHFITTLQSRLRAEPAFAHAAVGTAGPLGHTELYYTVEVPGRTGTHHLTAAYIAAGPGFLRLVGLPVLRGRDFTAGDDRGHERVALIDALFARRYFGSTDPIGRTVLLNRAPLLNRTSPERLRVIGLIPSVRMRDVDEAPEPIIVEAIAQRPWPVLTVVTPTVRDVGQMRAEIDRVLAVVDPSAAGIETFTARRLVDDATARQRHVVLGATAGAIIAWLLVFCAVLTLPRPRLLRRRLMNRSI
ncbi:MAG: hypothetical protein NVS3B7_08450 [Candidatus Elarobacter sp.]